MINEFWVDIKGFEGLYQVSNLGRVKSLPKFLINSPNGITGFFTKELILKPSLDFKGYQLIGLRKNGIRSTKKVHRLVAENFIPNPNLLPQVNHKDEVKTNNEASNLEWCNNSYNQSYGTNPQRRSEKTRNNNRSIGINQFSVGGKLIKSYPSMREAQRSGFLQPSISRCCSGKQRTHLGYIWRYADD